MARLVAITVIAAAALLALAPTALAGIVRINVGGGAYTAQSGERWLADSYFTGGALGTTTASIAKTTDPALYQDERWGNFAYAIPVANGSYDLRLHFVELYYKQPCSGARIFSIDVLDTAASPDLANLDICATAGVNTALVKTIPNITVSDGTLNIQSVYGSADDPELTAIEVVPSGGGGASAPPPPPPPTTTSGLPPLSVVGNHLLRNGQIFSFHGVNRDSLEWGRYNWGGCGGDGHFTDADFDRILAWNVNAVRIPLSEANWLGRRCDPTTYAAAVDAAVAKANARGMYAILDLHWSDVGGLAPCDSGCGTGQQPMPDSDSITFWKQVAARYAGNSGVVFDLYNEPHGVSWSCWRNGGCSVLSSTVNPATGQKVTYTAVGMQQLYDVVHTAAPSSVVLVAGLDWAYDLSGIGNGFAISGPNVVYDTHVYVRWHFTVSDWDTHFGYLTASAPVSATEFGSTDCSTNVTSGLLGYFDSPEGVAANRMSWTIWSWNNPGDCGQPSVIADWFGTPLAGQGQLIHDTLLAYGG